MSKNKRHRDGIVFSTDPDFKFDEVREEESSGHDKGSMSLRVSLDRKQRGGKEVTLVSGFKGNSLEMEDLGKQLKNKCGVGGSAKDGEIILQGNHKDKVIRMLIEWGYKGTKGSGG